MMTSLPVTVQVVGISPVPLTFLGLADVDPDNLPNLVIQVRHVIVILSLSWAIGILTLD
jgi:hypothetical protein